MLVRITIADYSNCIQSRYELEIAPKIALF